MITGANHIVLAKDLPSALDCLDNIIPGDDQEPAMFLDYDGTLTPIVSNPADAALGDTMRIILQRLSGLCELAIISGRDLADVRQRVGIDSIWYAGSHGFDIAGPQRVHRKYQEGSDYLPLLDAAEQQLRERLRTIAGCRVERKHFAIAVHYREASADNETAAKHITRDVHAAHPGLRLSGGKKILELQPDIDWDKGKALRWLMQALDMDPARFIPVYIGDDVTDEDAFRELAAVGIGILVTKNNTTQKYTTQEVTPQSEQPTRAAYRLDDHQAVQQFLSRMSEILERKRQPTGLHP